MKKTFLCILIILALIIVAIWMSSVMKLKRDKSTSDIVFQQPNTNTQAIDNSNMPEYQQNPNARFVVDMVYTLANGEQYTYKGQTTINGTTRDVFRYYFSIPQLKGKWQDMVLLDTFHSTSIEESINNYSAIVKRINELNKEKSVTIENVQNIRTLAMYHLKNTKPTQNTFDLANYYTSEIRKLSEYPPTFIPDFDIINHN